MPGETTWTETERFLLSIGVRVGSEPAADGTVFHGTGGLDFVTFGIRNRVDFIERDNVVEWIQIDADGYEAAAEFNSVWSAYAPERVIARYGQPSRIWIQTFSFSSEGIPATMPYDLWLYYDELGFLIRYGGSTEYKPTYRICPTVEGGNIGPHIEMYLQSPQSQNNLEDLVGEKAGLPESIMPLDEAAELSVEEFYALYSQTSQPNCFETPRDIWP